MAFNDANESMVPAKEPTRKRNYHKRSSATAEQQNETGEGSTETGGAKKISRRGFVKTAATAATVAAAIPLVPLLGGKESAAEASVIAYGPSARAQASLNFRDDAAAAEFIVNPEAGDNGDSTLYTDFSWSYSKALLHDDLGIPDPASWNSLDYALTNGTFQDFENIRIGTPDGGPNSKLNGPQGSLAFDLEGLDSHATVIPAAPPVASNQTAAEQVEHYWAALLRDVPFTSYSGSTLAQQAVNDLNSRKYISGPNNKEYPYPVTLQNLFRGQVTPGDGNVLGPYISQFLLQPTVFGAIPITQQIQTFLSINAGGSDFLTNITQFMDVQNGSASFGTLTMDPTLRYLRNGRDLAAYTHNDILYQAYLIASSILSLIGAQPNPGIPYTSSSPEKPFVTLGGPDIVGTMAEMATRALKAGWFHKWIVNLRLRPEEYGALVQARITNAKPLPQAAAALTNEILNSAALPLIFAASGNQSYLLPQAFPEGCPTHPCYPTGHGTVAGACITALKFFFNTGTTAAPVYIQPLLIAAGRNVYVPNTSGTSLQVYTGSDAGQLNLNGELLKLAFNISFAHGIHAGIHFRSSTLQSILLGEQVALSVLKDRAHSYNEPIDITITKFDGTTATIFN